MSSPRPCVFTSVVKIETPGRLLDLCSTLVVGIGTLPVGANHVTEYMQSLLAKKGFPTGKKRDRLLARAIKTKLSYAAPGMCRASLRTGLSFK